MNIFALKDGALARFFAVLTTLMMIMSLLPMQAFAQEVPMVEQPAEVIGADDSTNVESDKKKEKKEDPIVGEGVENSDFATLTTQRVFRPEEITFCHATASDHNPYELLERTKVELFAQGHLSDNGTHGGDIIPPFENPFPIPDYEGKNWGPEGQAIWNNDCEVASITVNKIVLGNDEVKAADFTFFADEEKIKQGKKESFNAGVYTITETPKDDTPTNYVATFSGDCTENGEITLEVGDNAVCTITNDYTDEPTTPTTVKVYIYKHLKSGDTTTQVPDNAEIQMFPMISSWNTVNYGAGNGTYELGDNQGGATLQYSAVTDPLLTGDDYATSEVTGDSVLAPDMQCVPGKYRLVGYKDGATLQAAQGDSISLTAPSYTDLSSDMHVIVVNELCPQETPEEVATIVATKLVCTDESDLPNWGQGAQVNIDAQTAINWEASHESCDFQEGWEFQWAQHNVADPRDGDDTDPSGAGWSAFDSVTDANGIAEVELTAAEINGGAHVWVREVLQDGYIPFTWFGAQDNSNNVSAEIYCASDVLNYDNWERVDGITVENTYHCVAWNVPEADPVDPICIGGNLLKNGDFEDPVQSNGAGWDIVETGTSGLEWIVSWVSGILNAPEDANLELHFGVNGWEPSEGEQYAELDADWGGPSSGQTGEEASVKIAQTVTTEPNAKYRLSYDFSARPGTGAADNVLEVSVENGLVDTQTAGNATNQTVWTSDSYEFTAADNATLIAFEDAGTPNSEGTFLDNASLCKIEEAPKVPAITLNATKVVCDTEAAMPNGQLAKPITAATAQAWVDGSNGACHLEEGWSFEWGAAGAGDGGLTTIGHAPNYTTFGPTNASGFTSTVIPLEGLNGRIETREVLQSGYIPFAADLGAEFYCANDAAGFDNWEWIQNPVDGDTFNCVAFNVPETSEVTLCKVDAQQNELKDWTLMLLGDEVGEVNVNPDGTDYTLANVPAGDYVLRASGVYTYRSDAVASTTDAAFSYRLPGDLFYTGAYLPWVNVNDFDAPYEGWLGIMFNHSVTDWGSIYNPNHEYAHAISTVVEQDFDFSITDDQYGDNSGSIKVEVFKGFAGATEEETGCVTFQNVPMGEYIVAEIMQEGWENVSGLVEVVVDNATETFTVVNQLDEPEMCTLSIVSNTNDQVESTGNDAELVTFFHDSWDAVVGGLASWIWSEDPIAEPVDETEEKFTKSFTWSGDEADIESATLTIAADNSYVAKINDDVAASDATEFNYVASTVHDVKALIETGENDLEFVVKNWAMENGTYQTNPGGLIYELVIEGVNEDCANDGEEDGGGENGGGDNDDEFTLVVATSGEGDGVISGVGINCDSKNEESDCSQTYAEGTIVTLTVTPDDGSTFENTWAVEADNCTEHASPCTITMNANKAVDAHFDLEDDGGDSSNSDSNNRSAGGRVSLTDDNDDDDFGFGGDDTDLPEGRVLGESASIMPVGAPNTGAGGASNTSSASDDALIMLLVLAFTTFLYGRVIKA